MFWEGLYEVCARLTTWLPKLCMALRIDESNSTQEKREKMKISAAVACQQIKAVERVLLHALAVGAVGVGAAVVGCVWSAPDQQHTAQLLGSPLPPLPFPSSLPPYYSHLYILSI